MTAATVTRLMPGRPPRAPSMTLLAAMLAVPRQTLRIDCPICGRGGHDKRTCALRDEDDVVAAKVATIGGGS